jgi:hypothetical protein
MAVYFGFLDLSSSSSVTLTRLSGPRSRPTTTQKIWQRRESKPVTSGSAARTSIEAVKQPIPTAVFFYQEFFFAHHHPHILFLITRPFSFASMR